MLYRCRNPRAKAFANYGGRGITVCPQWHSFEGFYADMGQGHWKGAEIDRIDPNGNYEPGNCRWVTTKENLRNRRNSVTVTYRGGSVEPGEPMRGAGRVPAQRAESAEVGVGP